MMITEKIKVSDKVLASGGFADVRSGKYKGHPVAVKTMRITEKDDPLKIRKVRVDDIFSALRAWYQPSYSSNFARKSFYGIHYPTQTS